MLAIFGAMKKYVAILNISLLLSVLSSIVFPATHAFEHIIAAYSTNQCIHKVEKGKPQFTHEHSHLDHCYLCEFSLGNFVAPEIAGFSFFATHQTIPYFFTVPETPGSFSGISYSLRGPPTA